MSMAGVTGPATIKNTETPEKCLLGPEHPVGAKKLVTGDAQLRYRTVTRDRDAHFARPSASLNPRDNEIPPAHDKRMAASFLASLDPTAERFTFQFFEDGPDEYGKIFHGTLDQAWPKVEALNTLERRIGVFVTIGETDFNGRREENVLRPRALFVDADTPEQIASSINETEAAGATPSMIVKSGRGLHLYWLCSDIPRDQFSALQKRLIEKLGTDKSIHDLPRVLRLPGTLHLKDAARPRLVKLQSVTSARWGCSELIAKFGMSPPSEVPATNAPPPNNVVPFALPDWARKGPAPAFAHLPPESLAEGLRPNIDQIRAAAAAIPPSTIAAESDWEDFARAFAHEAAIHKGYTEQLWEILDTASQQAPGYDQQDNRERYLRYIREAFNRPKPITIFTLLHMARQHGWDEKASSSGLGGSTSTSGIAGASANSNSSAGSANQHRAVHVSQLPTIPPKRKWLHGNDLIRGAVSVLVAPGGRAKSTWLLACALACASGRDLLGAHVFGGPLRVLCLSTEDGLPEMALRIRAAMTHFGLSDADLPGLHIIGADGWGLPLLQMDGKRAVFDTAGMNALIAELDHTKPDLLIIDPLINALGGVDPSENGAAALLMRQLVHLATTRQMAVALAHHTSKGRDIASAESAMGAVSFINLARIALSIEPLDEKNAGTVGLPPWEAKSIFRILGTKQNFSAPKTEDRWFRIVSIPMPNPEPPIYMTGDSVAVVEPFKPGVSGPAFPDALVRDVLAVIDAASPPLTPSKRSHERYAAPVIADAIKSHRAGQASEGDGKAVLDHLINTGLAVVADVKVSRGGKGSDTRKGLVLTSAGKLAVKQNIEPASPYSTPHSPESPATMLQDDAGGDPSGPPQRRGGVGENAGCRSDAVIDRLPSAPTD